MLSNALIVALNSLGMSVAERVFTLHITITASASAQIMSFNGQ